MVTNHADVPNNNRVIIQPPSSFIHHFLAHFPPCSALCQKCPPTIHHWLFRLFPLSNHHHFPDNSPNHPPSSTSYRDRSKPPCLPPVSSKYKLVRLTRPGDTRSNLIKIPKLLQSTLPALPCPPPHPRPSHPLPSPRQVPRTGPAALAVIVRSVSTTQFLP